MNIYLSDSSNETSISLKSFEEPGDDISNFFLSGFFRLSLLGTSVFAFGEEQMPGVQQGEKRSTLVWPKAEKGL